MTTPTTPATSAPSHHSAPDAGSAKGGFSFRSRAEALQRLRSEDFDLLIIGGGITGAATARDAVSRGLKVALVERSDYASGTSSGSSKLIHGGLRYLENMEFGLVFESLAERALLLKTAPHMVRPLPFYMPVYRDSAVGSGALSVGMWLYDMLSMFRAPGYHKRLSAEQMKQELPALKQDGLKSGFRYYDATMWDDVLAVESVRAAVKQGAAAANYVEAVEPLWENDQVAGFHCRDRDSAQEDTFCIRARRVVVCAGPWVDRVGLTLSSDWTRWLTPSKGVHLIVESKRFPLPGAVTLINPEDKRVGFAIPRPDFGAGVTIIGTTDSPTPSDPAKAVVDPEDVDYLLGMMARYFPALNLTVDDIISSYVGVRPLFMPEVSEEEGGKSLQKISREHHIGQGPGGVVIVAGGKYTTSRKMAEEIVDFTLKRWKRDARAGIVAALPEDLRAPDTKGPLIHEAMPEAVARARAEAAAHNLSIDESLWDRFGAEALVIKRLDDDYEGERMEDPEGFPLLVGQLRFLIHEGMVMHLEDFFLRRQALFLARRDHGLPWADLLARVWAAELGRSVAEAEAEAERLRTELQRRDDWIRAAQQTGQS